MCLIDEIEKLNFNCDWKWSMKEVELEVEQNQKNYNELYLQIEGNINQIIRNIILLSLWQKFSSQSKNEEIV